MTFFDIIVIGQLSIIIYIYYNIRHMHKRYCHLRMAKKRLCNKHLYNIYISPGRQNAT